MPKTTLSRFSKAPLIASLIAILILGITQIPRAQAQSQAQPSTTPPSHGPSSIDDVSPTANPDTAAAGNLVILACGALWLAAMTHAPVQSILTLAVVPFLPGDALKIVAAAALATGWQRFRRTA